MHVARLEAQATYSHTLQRYYKLCCIVVETPDIQATIHILCRGSEGCTIEVLLYIYIRMYIYTHTYTPVGSILFYSQIERTQKRYV